MEKQKKITIYHPFGNANTRAAVDGIFKKGILESFHTCIACFEGSMLYKLSSLSLLKELKRRKFSLFIANRTFTHPFKELGRQLSLRLKLNKLVEHEKGIFCVDNICHNLDNKVAKYIKKNKDKIGGVYAYEDLALESFRTAKDNNIKCLYDLPIGYWRAMRSLLDEEREKNPEWAVTLGGFNDSSKKLQRKDEELRLADKIYVASSFTKKTLEMYPGKLADIEVIPYGFPPVNNERKYDNIMDRKIRVLFVGNLSQRKGISYFFDSIKGLDDKIEATVVGRGNIDSSKALKESLSKVNYIPSLPHNEILKLMSNHDLFIFPSLFEGFGLVITEAMSQGTPVITTDRTCGADIITNGVDGWVIQAGTSEPLKKLLHKFINDPIILVNAGKKAMETASKRPWSVYEKELAESVKRFLND
ncbi:glycosyltransferase family 4 protein [Bacteroides ilei]|uniref:glycosyltransferase family 4 protein n=1 Tax=Bacteroides ilei TaxID=1907658 RepID=UPI0009311265|nr:glycosyltransferase family 4 protein [Bacteroides ilei]